MFSRVLPHAWPVSTGFRGVLPPLRLSQRNLASSTPAPISPSLSRIVLSALGTLTYLRSGGEQLSHGREESVRRKRLLKKRYQWILLGATVRNAHRITPARGGWFRPRNLKQPRVQESKNSVACRTKESWNWKSEPWPASG